MGVFDAIVVNVLIKIIQAVVKGKCCKLATHALSRKQGLLSTFGEQMRQISKNYKTANFMGPSVEAKIFLGR